MKICYLFSNYHLVELTAEPKIAVKLAQHAAKRNYSCHVISNSTHSGTKQKGRINFFLIEGLGDFKTYLYNLPKIIWHLIKVQPDILHVHGGIILVYAWSINLLFKKPTVFTLCESFDMFTGLQRKLMVFCLTRVNKIFVTSEFFRRQLIENGINPSLVEVARIGLDEKFLNFRSQTSPDADILFFGDSSRERGFDIVYKLAKRLPNTLFKILIRWRKNCLKELKGLKNMKNVRVIHKPTEPLITIIAKSRLVFLPFRWMGVRPPLSIIESMAMGKCVFTSTMEGNEEIIMDKKNGKLSDFKNMTVVENQIKHLLGNNKIIKKIGSNARTTIRNMYSELEYIKIIDTYAKI